MKKNSINQLSIYHQASLKLAVFYLVIIVAISLSFSLLLFRITSNEIERSIYRQNGPIGQLLRARNNNDYQLFLNNQQAAIDDAKIRLKSNLFFINLGIFISGGLASYFMARRTLQPIEEAHEVQARFTADASHELRTPIAAMRIENELALTDPTLTVNHAKKQLESNIEELDKLTHLTESLLQLARIENTTENNVKVNIKKVIEESIETISPQTKKRHQKIVQKLNSALVFGNATALNEAITILLDNASKYSPDNATITITSSKQKKQTVVRVSDKGIGIRSSDLPHIFDRFYRADQSRTKNIVSGYGIGLSIAKKIIEQHKGSIEAKSEVGKGTTFTVQLPLSSSQD